MQVAYIPVLVESPILFQSSFSRKLSWTERDDYTTPRLLFWNTEGNGEWRMENGERRKGEEEKRREGEKEKWRKGEEEYRKVALQYRPTPFDKFMAGLMVCA